MSLGNLTLAAVSKTIAGGQNRLINPEKQPKQLTMATLESRGGNFNDVNVVQGGEGDGDDGDDDNDDDDEDDDNDDDDNEEDNDEDDNDEDDDEVNDDGQDAKSTGGRKSVVQVHKRRRRRTLKVKAAGRDEENNDLELESWEEVVEERENGGEGQEVEEVVVDWS